MCSTEIAFCMIQVQNSFTPSRRGEPVPSKMRKRGLTEVTEGKVEANQGKNRVNEDEGVRMSVETVSA